MSALLADFSTEVRHRLDDLDQEVRAGGLDPAIDLIVSSLQRGGVLQAFGTGHSQAFAMEIAGRAGGLIPAHPLHPSRWTAYVTLGGFVLWYQASFTMLVCFFWGA